MRLISFYLYRMLKKTSSYVGWLLIGFFFFMTTVTLKEYMSFSAIFNEMAMMINLILVIITVGFLRSERQNGFVKQIINAGFNRSTHIIAKQVYILVYVAITYVVMYLGTVLGSASSGYSIEMSFDLKTLATFLSAIAFCNIGLMLSELFRSSGLSSVLSIIISTGLPARLLVLVEVLVRGKKSDVLDSSLITQKIFLSNQSGLVTSILGGYHPERVVFIALVYIVITLAVSIWSINSRDMI